MYEKAIGAESEKRRRIIVGMDDLRNFNLDLARR
jgi:hypothetical protein